MVKSIEGTGNKLKIPILIECGNESEVELAVREYLTNLHQIERDGKIYLTPEVNIMTRSDELRKSGFIIK